MRERDMAYRITSHARQEMHRRDIPQEAVNTVLDRPEQIVEVSRGRKALQSKYVINGKTFLIRAIIDGSEEPIAVITIYRTSKIAKYWRN